MKEEISKVWKLDNVSMVLIVICTIGVIPRALHNAIRILDLLKFSYLILQKATILNACRINHKFLQLSSDNECNNKPLLSKYWSNFSM